MYVHISSNLDCTPYKHHTYQSLDIHLLCIYGFISKLRFFFHSSFFLKNLKFCFALKRRASNVGIAISCELLQELCFFSEYILFLIFFSTKHFSFKWFVSPKTRTASTTSEFQKQESPPVL